MTNQPQNTTKPIFPPGKMVCHAPKLEQFRPNLKLKQICQNWKIPAISTVSAQFRARFQFWSSSFVPNCPNWTESLLFQGLASLEVFRKKTPSPYGRECPYGGNSPVEGFVVLISSFPITKQEVSMEKTNQPILLSLDLGMLPDGRSNKHGRIMSGTAHFVPSS